MEGDTFAMIVLNINGIEITGRFKKQRNLKTAGESAWPTAIKRAALIDAFEHMPSDMIDRIWARAVTQDRPKTNLELLPALNDKKE